MKFSDRLNEAMKRYNISATELCNRTGIPKSAMSQYRSGAFEPKADRLSLLAKALNVSEAWLMGYDIEPNATFTPFIQAPLYESISAGLGTTKSEPIGTHPCVVHNQEEAENTLCVIVEGDSMSPKIENGDIVQIRQQRSVDSGDIAAVLLDNEDYFVKKVEYGTDYIRLISINQNYKPITLKGAEVQRCFVLGKVVTITKRC